jgi:hypothetical protein
MIWIRSHGFRFTFDFDSPRSNQMNVAFHRLNEGVHAAGQYLFGHTQGEAFGRVEGHVRRQRTNSIFPFR